jgi:hypothetical protein
MVDEGKEVQQSLDAVERIPQARVVIAREPALPRKIFIQIATSSQLTSQCNPTEWLFHSQCVQCAGIPLACYP